MIADRTAMSMMANKKDLNMMTNAEAKVKELSEKLLDIITCSRNSNVSPETTLEKLEAYLSGICDGIDFSEEMRSIQESAPARKEITKTRIYPDMPDCPQKQPAISGEEN